MAKDTRAAFEALLEAVGPALRKAFVDAIADVRGVAQLRVIEDAIARGDVAAVVQALSLGPEFFAPLDRAIQEAFLAGGLYQVGLLPARVPLPGGERLVVRFDGRHHRAEAWTRDHAAALVTEVAEDTRTAARETVTAGLAASTPPRALARQVIGTGPGRKGGIVGLTSGQARYVTAMRAQLASGDPAEMAGYFTRERRDRRFDATVRRAMEAGKPVAAADIDRIAARYAERLLALRGSLIARTESLSALNAGREEGIRQMLETGKVPASAITKVWRSTPSKRTRDTHMALNGTEVPFGQPFQSLSGALMNHPGDTSMGAPASEIVACRCGLSYRIAWHSLAE